VMRIQIPNTPTENKMMVKPSFVRLPRNLKSEGNIKLLVPGEGGGGGRIDNLLLLLVR